MVLFTDLVEFELGEFEVILGMDWLNAHSTGINCWKRMISFRSTNEDCVIFNGREFKPSQMLFSICKSLDESSREELGHMCYVLGKNKGEK